MTWATSVPILVFLGLSILELGPMYATDRQTYRQTSDVRQTSDKNIDEMTLSPYGGGAIMSVILLASAVNNTIPCSCAAVCIALRSSCASVSYTSISSCIVQLLLGDVAVVVYRELKSSLCSYCVETLIDDGYYNDSTSIRPWFD